MSQKSILSFFKSADRISVKESEKKQNKVVVVDDSPVKSTKKKRKIQCIESDEESSDTANKKLSSKCGKVSEVSDSEVESNEQSLVKAENGLPRNGNVLPGKSESQKNVEDGEEATSLQSSTNIQLDEVEKIENEDVHENSSVEAEETSTTNQNDAIKFIPKRKTARKQMRTSKDVKGSTQLDTNGLESKCDSKVQCTSMTTEEKKNLENSDNKSELKIESNLVTSDDKDEPKQNSENKELVEDAVSKNSKHKASILAKHKSSPLKKCAKKESIHSFFTPLKKEEKVSSEENCKIEKSLDVGDDSPIKMQKHKRKSQILESDDEDDEPVCKKVSVKMETEVNEVNGVKESSSQSQENKDVKSENSISDENTKMTENENIKANKETQKLGIKSTSDIGTGYDPSKSSYHPIEDACWKKNEKVPYLALAKTLELIENTSGRLKTIEILSNFFRSVIVLSPEDLLHSIYLCLNRVAPEYEGIEMGIGETLLMKALAQATGRTLDKIKAEVAVKGDLGLVSESSRGNQRVMFAPPKLTVSAVFNKFLEIAKMSGNTSMAKKTDKIKTLFVACRDCESKYIIRSLSGKLRIGLAEQSILSAIARAAVVTPSGQEYPPEIINASKGMSSESFKKFLDTQILILKTAYCECPNYDLIIPVLLKEGISALPDHCQLSPGVPLKPMLAHPTAGIDQVLERLDKNAFTCEFKYDGERAQIHMNDKGEVKIFSRNQEDNTSKYPDVISRISNALKESTKSFILDSEAVAWDREIKQILPFQVLSTRKRKDAVESDIVVQVCVMAFDLLYLNGESLVKKPLKERRNLLHSSFIEVENQFMFAQYRDGDSAETMQEFLDESIKSNCEGLMVKSLEVDAAYEIAKRSHNWLKLKKDYLQGIGDTLDLVVIGGYYGKGKRTGNYGGFLLACYDVDDEEFQSICKLGTGFKEDVLAAHTKFLKQHVIEEPKSYYRYDQSLEPDVWFEPVQVWEIKCADLSISPVHKAAAGIVDPEKGISLRFPRFIRIRDDKSPVDATNSVQIADMYRNQQQIQNTANKDTKAEEDYY